MDPEKQESLNEQEEDAARTMSSSFSDGLFLKRTGPNKELDGGNVLLLISTPECVMAKIHELFPQGGAAERPAE